MARSARPARQQSTINKQGSQRSEPIDGMTLSSTVFHLHCGACILFLPPFHPSTLAIYGRNPDLNLTACVSQIRSVLCITGGILGPSANSCSPGQ